MDRTYLTFDEIKIRENEVNTEDVFISSWGGYIQIRPILLADINEIARNCTDPRSGVLDLDKQKILFIMKTVVNPTLAYAQAAELCSDQLKAGSHAQFWGALNRINGLSGDSVEEATKSVSQ